PNSLSSARNRSTVRSESSTSCSNRGISGSVRTTLSSTTSASTAITRSATETRVSTDICRQSQLVIPSSEPAGKDQQAKTHQLKGQSSTRHLPPQPGLSPSPLPPPARKPVVNGEQRGVVQAVDDVA